MAQFQNTRRVIGYNFSGIQPGQWVALDDQRGQYLGTTSAGTVVIRWQQQDAPRFAKRDAQANKPLRAYAKRYGAR